MKTNLYNKLDDVFYYSPSPIRIIDLNYDTVSVNDAFISLSGMHETDIYNAKCYQSLSCSICKTPICPLEQIRNGEFRFESEIEIAYGADLKSFYILTAVPLIDDEGELEGIIEYYKDITYLKNIENQVRSSEERFRNIYDNMINGIMSYRITESGDDFVLQDLNNSASFIEQLEKNEAVGMRFTELFPNQSEHGLLKLYLQVYKTGESELTPPYFYHDDRVSGWRESFVFRSGSGEIVTIFEDITINKQNEEKNLKLISAIEHNPSSIIITDNKHRIEYANPSFTRITGYTQLEARGKTLSILTENSASGSSIEMVLPELDRGESWEGELLHQKKSGASYYDKLSIVPIINSKKEIVNFVVTHNDISEFKRLQSNLLQAQKMESVGQLSAGIAHEINTPVQYISDNLKFISQGLEPIFSAVKKIKNSTDYNEIMDLVKNLNNSDFDYLAEEIPLALTQSLEGADQIASIIKAMKEFSHPGVRDRVNTDINKLIQTVLSISKNEWKYNCQTVTELAPDLPHILVYANEINQVLLNIIVNAAQAIGNQIEAKVIEHGLIKIVSAVENGFVKITIQDNGGGIPDEIKNNIYDPFFTTKDVGKGSGQGLYIAHDIIVNKHHGRIELESQVGNGCEFKIYLPVV